MKISPKTKSLFWIVLVVSVLVLSWVGLSQLYPETSTLRYLPDRIFRLIKILMGNDPVSPAVERADIPLALIIVKVLVIILLLRALFKIVEKVFYEQYTHLRIAYKKGHLIVVGVGNKGSRILKDYQAQTGRTAVAIEQKADHKNLPSLRRDGHAIVTGSATDEETLQTAGALKARTVICLGDDEQTGVQVAGKLIDLYAKKKPENLLQCFVHLEAPRLVEIFEQHGHAHIHASVDVRFFNLHKVIARHFFHRLPQMLENKLQHPRAEVRFLLFGFDAAAQALLIQAMRVFHLLPGQSSHWHIFARDMATKAARFHDRYPQIGHIAPLQFFEDQGCYAQVMQPYLASQPVHGQIIVICASDEECTNLRAAAELLNASAQQDFPIFVLNAGGKAMAGLLSGRASTRLHFFGDYDDFCKYELITGERQDDWARAMHNDYLRQISGAASESSAYQTSWDDLSEDAKDANRAQADHIIYKLLLTHKHGVDQKPADLRFSTEEIEQLAMAEHARWAAHRYLNGWQYGEVRDDARKLHPSLVGWEDLAEDEKQKDRNTVLRLPQILHAA